jgi:hypothetical protein
MQRGRTAQEANLHYMLQHNLDNFERSNADAPAASNPAAKLSGAKYNPPFDAQFDLTLKLLYFTVSGGVFTQLTAAALAAAQGSLATKLPVFIFGQSDFKAGYAKAQGQYPVSVWAFGVPFIYGKDFAVITGQNPFLAPIAIDTNVASQLSIGDLVQPFYAVLGGVTYVALSVVDCSNVAYGTLLESTSSDRFLMNLIRYTQNDTSNTGLNQYNQKIGWYKQSLFGKFDSDTASPNAFKMPENLQSGIIDIPLVKSITKESFVATYLLYTSVTIQWSIFIQTVKKAGAIDPL